MKYPPDDSSSHIREAKKTYIDGANNASRVDAESEGQVEEAVRDLYGFRPIPAGAAPVTNELVNRLREELGI